MDATDNTDSQAYLPIENLLQLSDEQLKRDYLNYLKWTEPISQFLQQVDDEVQVLRVVKLALEVDWLLGANLAGAVKPEFQAACVALVAELEIPQDLQFHLLGITRSDCAIPILVSALNHTKENGQKIKALGNIGSEMAVEALIGALNHQSYDVRDYAAEELGKIGSQRAVEQLIYALKDFSVRSSAGMVLGWIGKEKAVEALIYALKDLDSGVRSNAARALADIGSNQAVEPLISTLNDKSADVRKAAALALEKCGSSELLPDLIEVLREVLQTIEYNRLFILEPLASIQKRCGYYNHAIASSTRC